MIKLMNEQLVLCNEIPLQGQDTLEDLLMLGWRLKVLINTHSVRNIGKTTALINLAKKYDFTIVVGSSNTANFYKKEYKFNNIYCQHDLSLRKKCKILIDESVDVNKLLKDMECDIVTGFYSEACNKGKMENELNFKDNAIETLKEEAEIINKLRKKALDNYEHTNYKLLINNYKQVLEIINELEGVKPTQQININWDNMKTTDISKFIDDSLRKAINKNINQ